ncbi:hypothetical protein Mkiyose1665_51750 [Mycobacterium kiyosense]|uniref:Uncharacterized protein n=2 Tax=Mycobacteriaceae TaxID=1762 RepID=A0A9P3Q966_9MYCO|nr:hypothetical protein IWGMT90018_40630 [Mycobacterium kiyosense]BDE13226.1 hypothetical protein MKCMC460_20860 [Mycobacterium sp. 20KCMC460]GLB85384.1 hypothetical protein SRL2020028_46400 [Mycobacterium kiyosense]GLB90639.1 hypothetical protein SRL2020130_34560 [Mycobacterium kiyosense]GLB96567.1 hypothetical protein SRL2020226_33430 [Mycobacterium kiyosense]
MALMNELIGLAASDPEAALAQLAQPDRAAEVARLFGDEEGLLLSLRQRWVTALSAKLDQADYEGISAEQARADLAAARPGLRALLDAAGRRSLRLRALAGGEQRVVDLFLGSMVDRLTVA